MNVYKPNKLTVGVFTVFLFILQACGGGDFGKIKGFDTGNVITLDGGSVLVSKGFDRSTLPEGVSGAYLMSSNDIDVEDNTNVAEGDVAGFVLESSRDPISITELIEAYRQAITFALGGFDSVSTITLTRNEDGDIAQAVYQIQSSTNKSSTDISNAALLALLQLMDVDTSLLEADLPNALTGQYEGNVFQLSLTLSDLSGDAIVAMGAAVPESKSDIYTQLVKSLVDPSNLISVEQSLTEATDETVIESSNGVVAKTDFLFVIDNSASMSDEQIALSQAAGDFADTIAISDVDFSIAIITTDDPNPLSGAAMTDTEAFSILVEDIGTGGSNTERGSFMAQEALQDTAFGDAVEGPLKSIGFPREGASLSVIILTDEGNASSAVDPYSNLFIDREYRWYSIYNSNQPGTLDELAFATGGSVADIDVLSAFPAIMQSIAEDAGVSVNRIFLSHTPVASTIEVRVNGVAVVNDANNGWSLSNNSSGSSIVLRGNSKPEAGDTVTVRYKYAE